MPHTRSAKKQLRKNERRRLHNRSLVKAIRTQVKKVEAAERINAVVANSGTPIAAPMKKPVSPLARRMNNQKGCIR